MDLSKLKRGGSVAIISLVILAAGFAGFALRDHLHQKREQEVQQLLDAKDQALKQSEKKVTVSENKAAAAEGSKIVAEQRYQNALNRIKALERGGNASVTVNTDTTIVPDVCEPIQEMLGAEHEARVACGEALEFANTEIGHLKDANTELHAVSDLKDEKLTLQGEKLRLVTEDRDIQKHRKKLWRGTAVAGIITALILLL